LSTDAPDPLETPGAKAFTPLLTNDKTKVRQPEVFLFRELVLQAMVRSHLTSPTALAKLLRETGLAALNSGDLEVLSEKAFPEGHVDLLIKEATPRGVSRKVVVEVKRRAATKADVEQLVRYKQTLGAECVGAVLLTGGSSSRVKKLAEDSGVTVLDYSIEFRAEPASFEDLSSGFTIG
jgi:RecB family endonuclease NucS